MRYGSTMYGCTSLAVCPWVSGLSILIRAPARSPHRPHRDHRSLWVTGSSSRGGTGRRQKGPAQFRQAPDHRNLSSRIEAQTSRAAPRVALPASPAGRSGGIGGVPLEFWKCLSSARRLPCYPSDAAVVHQRRAVRAMCSRVQRWRFWRRRSRPSPCVPRLMIYPRVARRPG
jgi:hypothetical protein